MHKTTFSSLAQTIPCTVGSDGDLVTAFLMSLGTLGIHQVQLHVYVQMTINVPLKMLPIAFIRCPNGL